MKGDEASEGLRLKDGVINTDSGGGVRGWSDFTGRSDWLPTLQEGEDVQAEDQWV